MSLSSVGLSHLSSNSELLSFSDSPVKWRDYLTSQIASTKAEGYVSLIPRFIDQSIKWQNNMIAEHITNQSINRTINGLVDEQADAQSLLERLSKAIRSTNQSMVVNDSLSNERFDALAVSFRQSSNKQTSWKNEALRTRFTVLPVIQTVMNKLAGADQQCEEDDKTLRTLVRDAHPEFSQLDEREAKLKENQKNAGARSKDAIDHLRSLEKDAKELDQTLSQQARQSAVTQAQLACCSEQASESHQAIDRLRCEVSQLKEVENNENSMREIERLNQLHTKLDELRIRRTKVLSDLQPSTRNRARGRERLLFDPSSNELDRSYVQASPAQPKKRSRTSYFSEFDENHDDFGIAAPAPAKRHAPSTTQASHQSAKQSYQPALISPLVSSPRYQHNNQSFNPPATYQPSVQSISQSPSLQPLAPSFSPHPVEQPVSSRPVGGGVRFFDDSFSSESEDEQPVKPRAGVIRFRKND